MKQELHAAWVICPSKDNDNVFEKLLTPTKQVVVVVVVEGDDGDVVVVVGRSGDVSVVSKEVKERAKRNGEEREEEREEAKESMVQKRSVANECIRPIRVPT